MNNATELRNKIIAIFQQLSAGTIDPRIAKEMNNSAGKIVSTVKIQLQYAEMMGEKRSIPFVGTDPDFQVIK